MSAAAETTIPVNTPAHGGASTGVVVRTAFAITAARAHIAAACVIALGLLAIAMTYPVFTQTSDEPAHIACGLQLLTFHRYDYEPQHPPLARVMAALPLYLAGARADDHTKMWPEGNAILAWNGEYQRNLTLARLGTLPFYVLACIFVYLWASEFYRPSAALLTVILFATLPTVLAHAGLATTDMAVTAGLAMSMYALLRWWKEPTWSRALWLGVAMGVGVLSKFSFALFFVVAGCVFLMGNARGEVKGERLRLRPALKMLSGASIVTALLVWAGYGFRLVRVHSGAGWRGWISHVPLPFTDLVRGILQLGHHFRLGHASYLLGHTSMHGFVLFFPVALAVKTPLPVLALVLIGTVLAVRNSQRDGRQAALAALAAVLILLFCMPSSVTIGSRHLLPMMPLLCIVAAYPLNAAQQLASSGKRRAVQAAMIALIFCEAVAVWRQAPDYLTYFNVLADPKPERVLVDSDLDWGQDLGRLDEFCARNQIRHLTMAYFGSADVHRVRGIDVTELEPNARASGWVAISKTTRHLSLAAPGVAGTGREYAWLDAYTPVAQVGKSIDVYYIAGQP